MCDPLTVAAIAATVGGTAYNSKQQSDNIKAQTNAKNAAAAAEMTRQKAFQEEAASSFDNTRAPFENGKQIQALDQNVQQREAASDAAIEGQPQYESPGAGSAPDVVKGEIARRVAKGSTDAKSEMARGAKLTGLGDLFFNNSVNLTKGRRDLGMINDMSTRSASLLPLEQQVAANNASKSPNMYGDMLKAAGVAAGIYQFAVGGPTWGDLFGKAATGGGALTAQQLAAAPKIGMAQPLVF